MNNHESQNLLLYHKNQKCVMQTQMWFSTWFYILKNEIIFINICKNKSKSLKTLLIFFTLWMDSGEATILTAIIIATSAEHIKQKTEGRERNLHSLNLFEFVACLSPASNWLKKCVLLYLE